MFINIKSKENSKVVKEKIIKELNRKFIFKESSFKFIL